MGILLSWVNLLESSGVVLSASSEAAGLGIRSVLTPQIAEVWRSGSWGATTIDIDVDLGAVQPINALAVAAPRDGRLPSAAATVAAQISASVAPSRDNLQANPSSIAIGTGTYIAGANTTNVGAVTGPTGAGGARRIGSASATGAGVSLARAATLPVAGGTPYRITAWLRQGSAAAATRGTALTVDQFTGGSVTQRNTGPALLGALGVISRVRMQNRKAFRLREKMWIAKTEELLEQVLVQQLGPLGQQVLRQQDQLVLRLLLPLHPFQVQQ